MGEKVEASANSILRHTDDILKSQSMIHPNIVKMCRYVCTETIIIYNDAIVVLVGCCACVCACPCGSVV